MLDAIAQSNQLWSLPVTALSPMYKSKTKQGTKRKSQDDLPGARSAKHPKSTIDAFFSPKVSVRVGSGFNGVTGDVEDKILDVVLSEEQVRVMRMVVDEGKNIFFTGSAGTLQRIAFHFPFHAKGLTVMMALFWQAPGNLFF